MCKHSDTTHLRNIHGDEINWANARSVWRCDECSKIIFRGDLFYEEVS